MEHGIRYCEEGQLLLNRGSYGDKQYFTPATFEKMMPIKLSTLYPGVQDEYGVGLSWMRAWDAKSNRSLLSNNTIGHGAASGSVFRVDLDNELVIVLLRNDGWKDYESHLADFLRAIDDGIIDKKK